MSSNAFSATLELHTDSSPTFDSGDSRRSGNYISHACIRHVREFFPMHESTLAIRPSDNGAPKSLNRDVQLSVGIESQQAIDCVNIQDQLCLPGVLAMRHTSHAIRHANLTLGVVVKSPRADFQPTHITVHNPILKNITYPPIDIPRPVTLLTTSAADSPCALRVGVPLPSYANGIASPLRPSSPSAYRTRLEFFVLTSQSASEGVVNSPTGLFG